MTSLHDWMAALGSFFFFALEFLEFYIIIFKRTFLILPVYLIFFSPLSNKVSYYQKTEVTIQLLTYLHFKTI